MAVRKWLVLAIAATCIGSNITLLPANHLLARELREIRARDELRPGVPLPALVGGGRDGTRLAISYVSLSKQTVILVFTPGCAYCKNNWPNWSHVLSRVDATRARIAAVDLSGEATDEFIREHGLAGVPLFTSVDYSAGRAYKLRSVPTTLLISADGKLDRVWTGVLDANAVAELERAVQGP